MDTNTFTKKYYIKRKNTNCIKWDAPEVKNNIPMFIADMDFKVEDNIIKNLNKHINNSEFGYSYLPKDYKKQLIRWNKKRNNILYSKDAIRFSKGAIDALYQIIYSLTKEKDAILVNTPIYPPFFKTIKETSRKLITSKLIFKNEYLTFNYSDIENKIIKNNVKAFILCSPHNPIGRVWTHNELDKLFYILKKHNVIIISDEVHSDLILPKYNFIPSLSLSKYKNNIVVINALSKTFSLAIFNHSHIIIENKTYRDKLDKYQSKYHCSSPNIFSSYATYYGYIYGEKWINSLCKVIEENYNYFTKRLSKYVKILPLQGTYLLFVDFNKYTDNAYKFLSKKCHIISNAGETFSKEYSSWARINLATSLNNIKKACDNIEKELLKIDAVISKRS